VITTIVAFLAAVLLLLVGLVLVLVRDVAKALLVQEITGALAERLERGVRDAIAQLPPELADEYGPEWLEELAAARDRPLKALLLVRGLDKAAVRIAAEAVPITACSRDRVAVGNAANATIGLAAFSWLMAWAILESLGQSAPMTTASGQYSQAAWVYAGPVWAMCAFVVVLTAVRVVSFAGPKWNRNRRWRLTFVERSWQNQLRSGVRMISAVLVVSIFHGWMSDSGLNLLFVPGLLGALLFGICRPHLGVALSLASLSLGTAAGGGSLLLLEANLGFVAWTVMAVLVGGIAWISARAATVVRSV
jgi:hypothetical protein